MNIIECLNYLLLPSAGSHDEADIHQKKNIPNTYRIGWFYT